MNLEPLESESALKATDTEYDFSENNVQNRWLNTFASHTTENEGGTEFMGAGYLLSWLGMFPSRYDSYDELGKISPLISTNVKIFMFRTWFLFTHVWIQLSNNQLKDALIKYGGLWVAYNAQQQAPYLNSKLQHNIIMELKRQNHAVLLSDGMTVTAKDNFMITPPGDGAFILKNSWGTDFGDEGYLYISYYREQFVRVILQ